MRASSETSPRAAGSVKRSLRRERSHRQAPDSPTTVLKSLPKRVSWLKRHGRPRLALGQRSNAETALSNENGLPSLGNLVWALPRPPISSPLPLVESGPSAPADDTELIARVARAYTSAAAAHPGTGSFWTAFNDGVKRDIHIGLSSSDPAVWAQILRRPDQNAHFWGFDAVCKAPEGEVEPHELVFRNLNAEGDWRLSYALWLHGALISLAEAVGAMRVLYPETAPGVHYAVHGEPADPDVVLDGIAANIDADIDFPNPYPGEIGFKTRRGVVGFRALQAIYQAWRVAQIVKGRPNARVLEIGAGLGRTAYYAHRFFGLKDYTIIDIPLTNAAQGYFVGRTVGANAVAFVGEEKSPDQIKILPPERLTALTEDYDLILNVDSFTELDPPTVNKYWKFARERASFLLSINHEFNPIPLRELHRADPGCSYSRYPYWMRRGYVEELIAF